jgi:hypothetical protein
VDSRGSGSSNSSCGLLGPTTQHWALIVVAEGESEVTLHELVAQPGWERTKHQMTWNVSIHDKRWKVVKREKQTAFDDALIQNVGESLDRSHAGGTS